MALPSVRALPTLCSVSYNVTCPLTNPPPSQLAVLSSQSPSTFVVQERLKLFGNTLWNGALKMIPYHWVVPSRPVDERGQRATAKTNVFPIKREVKRSSIPWYHTSSSTNGTEISQRIRLHTGMRTRTIAIFLLNWMHSWDRVHCIVSSTTIKVPRDQSFLKISHFYNIDFFTNACSFFLFYSAPWKINIRKYNRLSLNVPQGWTLRVDNLPIKNVFVGLTTVAWPGTSLERPSSERKLTLFASGRSFAGKQLLSAEGKSCARAITIVPPPPPPPPPPAVANPSFSFYLKDRWTIITYYYILLHFCPQQGDWVLPSEENSKSGGYATHSPASLGCCSAVFRLQ